MQSCFNAIAASVRPGLESRCFSVKHAGAPSIGLYFAEKIMSAFEQILSNKKYFHHLIICQILFLTKIRWKKFTCNSILIVDSEIQLLFLWDWTSSEHRDSTLAANLCLVKLLLVTPFSLFSSQLQFGQGLEDSLFLLHRM